MKKYQCEFATRNDEYLVCTKTGEDCANVKFCRMSGRWEHNDNAPGCTLLKEQPVEQPVAKTRKKVAKKDA